MKSIRKCHIPEAAEGNPHLVGPQGLGFLLLSSDTWKKDVKSLSAKMMEKSLEKTPDLEGVGLMEVRRMASLWMQTVDVVSQDVSTQLGILPVLFFPCPMRL